MQGGVAYLKMGVQILGVGLPLIEGYKILNMSPNLGYICYCKGTEVNLKKAAFTPGQHVALQPIKRERARSSAFNSTTALRTAFSHL